MEFQSSPSREAGRCVLTASIIPSRVMFQSSPSREAGRCARQFADDVAKDLPVSILAQP